MLSKYTAFEIQIGKCEYIFCQNTHYETAAMCVTSLWDIDKCEKGN